LEVIISFYYVPKEIGELLMTIPLDKLKLELQAFFKTTMVHNLVEILKKDDKQCNHLKLWLFISTSRLLIQSISEYVKLARLAMC